MKVRIMCPHLQVAMQRCAAFVTNINSVPALACVLLRARDGQITLSATDMEFMVEVAVPGTILEPGECLIPHAAVAPIIAHVPGDIATIGSAEEADGMVTSLELGPYTGRMAAPDWVDFPIMTPHLVKAKPDEVDDPGHTFVMNAGQLRAMLDAVHAAMGTATTRYHLMGVCLHQEGDSLRAVATDGHRLVASDAPLPEGAEGLSGVIVPRDMVTYLRKVLPQVAPTAAVIVWRIGSYIRFTLADARPDLVLTGKTIDATYPAYQSVMPAPMPVDQAGRLIVHDGVVLAEILDALIGGSSDTARPTSIEVDERGLLLRMQQGDPIVASTMRIPSGVAMWDGRPPFFHAHYQIRYLRDLCLAGGRRFTLQPGLAEMSPALMQAGNVTGVVMAMRRDA